jgi:hypothetical protein
MPLRSSAVRAALAAVLADGVRLRIVDAGGAVIYDNQPGAPEDVDLVALLGGGSVVVHP